MKSPLSSILSILSVGVSSLSLISLLLRIREVALLEVLGSIVDFYRNLTGLIKMVLIDSWTHIVFHGWELPLWCVDIFIIWGFCFIASIRMRALDRVFHSHSEDETLTANDLRETTLLMVRKETLGVIMTPWLFLKSVTQLIEDYFRSNTEDYRQKYRDEIKRRALHSIGFGVLPIVGVLLFIIINGVGNWALSSV